MNCALLHAVSNRFVSLQHCPAGALIAGLAAIVLVLASGPTRAEPPGLFSGAYIGLNAGAAWGQSSFSTNPNCPPAIVDAPFCNAAPDPSVVNGEAVAASGSGKLSPSGFTGGVQAGYNWQRGHIVYGAEIDFGAFDLDKRGTESGLFPFPFLGTQYALTQKMSADWLATVRGRVGFTMMQHVLLYATGGLAFSDVKFASGYSDNAIDATFPGGSGYGAKAAIKTGWTAGGGVEWALHGNWLMRAEYLYVDLGSMRVAVPITNTPAFTQSMSANSDLTAQIGRLGLNYRY
ncbi:MAG: outer membrane beta-barrel protein [Hyphomicrobiaceae bacterium]